MIPQTGIGIVDWVLAALGSHGYPIVVAFTTLENLFVVGSFTPGETVVVAAGFVSAQGALWWPGVWLSSLLGTLLGSNISFFFGRREGRATLDGWAERIEGTLFARAVGIHRGSMDEAEAYFERYGSKTIFMSRFAVGLKNFMPVVAGASRMSVFHFELWTFTGAVTYTTAMVAIGWLLGDNFDLAIKVAGGIGWAGLLLVIAVFTAAVLLARRAQKRIAARFVPEEDSAGDDTAADDPAEDGER